MPDLGHTSGPADLAYVRDPEAARSLLDPLRRTILERLESPGSSSSVAQELGLPRQRVNYHVRILEETGLLRHVEDRRRGNCMERVVQSAARRYLVDPELPSDDGGVEAGPDDAHVGSTPDPFSSATLLDAAALTLRRAGKLHAEAAATGEALPAFALETRVHFRSPEAAREFALVLGRLIDRSLVRYHEPSEEEGVTFRISVGGHPDLEPCLAPHPPSAAPEPIPAPIRQEETS